MGQPGNLAVLAIVIGGLGLGCGDTLPPSGLYACEEDGSCPSGYLCHDDGTGAMKCFDPDKLPDPSADIDTTSSEGVATPDTTEPPSDTGVTEDAGQTDTFEDTSTPTDTFVPDLVVPEDTNQSSCVTEGSPCETDSVCDAALQCKVKPDGLPAGFVYVPAGVFKMGCTDAKACNADCMFDDKPVRAISLSSYAIQETEVTVVQFEECVSAGSCASHDDLGVATSTWVKYQQGASGLRPINSLNYGGAKAYCAFAGARLCTEAEWEKAARGADERCYPWGNASPDCSLATMKNAFDSLGCGTGFVRDVGTDTLAGESAYGAYDMAGNVVEWVSDWYDTYDPGELDNPAGPVSGEKRILRGGSYSSGPNDLTSYARWPVLEGSASSTNGVRCCWSP